MLVLTKIKMTKGDFFMAEDKVKPKRFRVSETDKEIDLLKYLVDTYAITLSGTTTDEGLVIGDCFRPEITGMIVYPKDLTFADRDEVFSEHLKQSDPKYFDNKRYGFTQLIAFLEGVSPKTAKNKATLLLNKQRNPQLHVPAPLAVTVQEVLDLPWYYDDKGGLQKRYENLALILMKENITVRFNEMSKRFEFDGIEHYRDMTDATFTMLRSTCLDNNLKLTKDDIYSFVEVIAAKNRYNPIADYLIACRDKTEKGSTSELVRLFDTLKYKTDDVAHIDFVQKMLLKWLYNCVHIAFNTLDAQRTCEIVPTFQGQQGKGKSKWVRALVPKGYFKGDIVLDLDDKDKVAELLAHWVSELGELGGTFSKSHRDKIKAFITSYQDTWRSPYGRSSNTYPRRTAIFATVNDDEFLVDKTGNRRFFVIPAEAVDYEHDVDIDKLWGQIMHLYECNTEPIYMTQEEQVINDIYNRAYTTKTDTELALDDLFDWDSQSWGACKLIDIERYAKEKTGRNYSANAIKQVLLQRGCINGRMTAGTEGKRKQDRYWKIPFIEGVTLPF